MLGRKDSMGPAPPGSQRPPVPQPGAGTERSCWACHCWCYNWFPGSVKGKSHSIDSSVMPPSKCLQSTWAFEGEMRNAVFWGCIFRRWTCQPLSLGQEAGGVVCWGTCGRGIVLRGIYCLGNFPLLLKTLRSKQAYRVTRCFCFDEGQSWN